MNKLYWLCRSQVFSWVFLEGFIRDILIFHNFCGERAERGDEKQS